MTKRTEKIDESEKERFTIMGALLLKFFDLLKGWHSERKSRRLFQKYVELCEWLGRSNADAWEVQGVGSKNHIEHMVERGWIERVKGMPGYYTLPGRMRLDL